MSNLDDERTDAEVSRRINSAPFMTYKEECESLREQVEKLKAELKSIDGALNDPRANLTLTTSEIIWELKEQVERLTKERDQYAHRKDQIQREFADFRATAVENYSVKVVPFQ